MPTAAEDLFTGILTFPSVHDPQLLDVRTGHDTDHGL